MAEVEGREKVPKETVMDKCWIGMLGGDQVLGILQYLPVESVLAFGMTCRRFRELTESEALWEFICRREWGSRAVKAWRSVGDRKTGWKRLYEQMRRLGSVFCRRLAQGEVVPTARASHSLNILSDTLILFGGGCEGGRHLDDTWAASLTDELAVGVKWQQVNYGIPSGRFGQSCTIVGDVLVLFGGINDNGVRQHDTWIGQILYDENSNIRVSWKLLEVAAAPVPRGAHAGCFAGDKSIVIYGGIGPGGLRLDDTWILDLSDGGQPCWHEVETLLSPPARSGHTLTWIGGKRMILFGGRGTHFEVLNDVWMFDMERNFPEWVELCGYEPNPSDGIPLPRSGHSATLVFGGRVLIYGGEDASRCRKGDAWLLDPNAGDAVHTQSSCTSRLLDPNAGDAVHTQSSCTSRPDTGTLDIMRKKIANKMWKELKQKGHPLKKRSFHGACAIDSGCSILIFGGMVDGEVMPSTTFGLGFDAELYLLDLVP